MSAAVSAALNNGSKLVMSQLPLLTAAIVGAIMASVSTHYSFGFFRNISYF